MSVGIRRICFDAQAGVIHKGIGYRGFVNRSGLASGSKKYVITLVVLLTSQIELGMVSTVLYL
jgi:hypothetical protein